MVITPRRSRRRHHLGAAAAALLMTSLPWTVACSPQTHDPATVSAVRSAGDCAWMQQIQPGAGPQVTLLVDTTADTVPQELPPPVVETIKAASKEAGSIVVLGVNGPGAQPLTILEGTALGDPGAGDARRERVAESVLACVEAAIQASHPTSPGSDVLAAWQEAMRRAPEGGQVDITSNMIFTGGVLDYQRLPVVEVDPLVVSTAVPTTEVPHGSGRSVNLYNAGEADPALSESARTWVVGVAMGLCERSGAMCTQHEERGASLTDVEAQASLADGSVTWPVSRVVTLTSNVEVDLPAALLFATDSAELAASADTAIDDVVSSMRSAHSLQVRGHSDSWCPSGRDWCVQLSQQRAAAVAEAILRRWPGPPPTVEVVGVGPDEPAIPDRAEDGSLVELAAAANRRVTITNTDEGAVGEDTEPLR